MHTVLYSEKEKKCRHLTRVLKTNGEFQWYYIVDRGVQYKFKENRWRWWSTEDAKHDVGLDDRKLDDARAFVPHLASLLSSCT